MTFGEVIWHRTSVFFCGCPRRRGSLSSQGSLVVVTANRQLNEFHRLRQTTIEVRVDVCNRERRIVSGF